MSNQMVFSQPLTTRYRERQSRKDVVAESLDVDVGKAHRPTFEA